MSESLPRHAAAAGVASLAVSASVAAVMGMPAIVGSDELAAMLAEFAALARREYQLVKDAAQCRRQRDAIAQLLDKAHMRADAAEDAIGYEKQRREEAEAALAVVDAELRELKR